MSTQYTPGNSRHLRGVTEEEFGFEHQVVLRAWTCKGFLVGEMRCPDYRAAAWRKILWAALRAPDCCPDHHGPICPDADARLRALMSRNREHLSLVRDPP